MCVYLLHRYLSTLDLHTCTPQVDVTHHLNQRTCLSGNLSVAYIITPIATPLTKSGNTIDKDGTFRLLEHVINGGVSGVSILGLNGEGPSLPRPCVVNSFRFAATTFVTILPKSMATSKVASVSFQVEAYASSSW